MNILVIAGCSAAIALSQCGHSVRIVERQEAWRFQSSGIFVYANGLVSFDKLGQLQEIQEAGFVITGGRNAYFYHNGAPIVEVIYPAADHGRIPAILGIKRAEIHRVMASQVATLGVPIRIGKTVTALDDWADGIMTTLSDGSSEMADFVVAVDGLRSATRKLVGIDIQSCYTGFGFCGSVHQYPKDLTDKIMMMG